MRKTYTYTITLDELEARRTAEILAQDGLTPEGVIRLLFERTAREGSLPIRKTRVPRQRPETVCPGLFVQGELFAPMSEPLADETDEVSEEALETVLRPSLITLTSLQEAQAKLRWRARERASADGAALFAPNDAPLALLETKQFRLDKSAIVGDPRRPTIIRALESLFTDITERRSPANSRPLEAGTSLVVPLEVEGDPLALIYEVGEGEICLIRYGSPDDLLQNPDALRS